MSLHVRRPANHRFQPAWTFLRYQPESARKRGELIKLINTGIKTLFYIIARALLAARALP